MSDLADAFDRALRIERVRNAEQIARFRFAALMAVFLVNLGFGVLRSGYIGAPTVPIALYALAAGVLLWAHRRSEMVSAWSGLAIALIDMPLALLLIWSVLGRLRAMGYTEDVAAVGTQLALFYLLLIIAASLSLQARHTWLAAGVALVLQSFLLIRHGRDLSFVILVDLTTVLCTSLALYTRRRSLRLVRSVALEETRRERLGRYFSPQVAETLANTTGEFGRGESREVTVLFADIRDFTALSERFDSRHVVDLLNAFHSRMVDCIFAAGGTLDKYLGDGLMAYFGAPAPQADHAERAVRCALAMQQALDALNPVWAEQGWPPLRMGIGIHTGPVVLGDIGAPRRREFTAIGDTVNVASRIEQLTKTHGTPVLISAATRRRLPEDLPCVAVAAVPVKGKSEPLQTYRLDLQPAMRKAQS